MLDPVIEYLDGPTIQHVRDVLALRMNREYNQYITTSKALTTFWIKIHRRTSHSCRDLSSCYGLDCWHQLRWFGISHEKMRERMRIRFGECENKDHSTSYVFQPVTDGQVARTRKLYTEWRALAYKRFGRTWTAAQDRKLAKLRAAVAAMEAEKTAFEKRKAFYGPLVKAENKRVKKARMLK